MKHEPKIKVYLVGSGPGDPGLLTVRARELLQHAEVVFYDHLVHPDVLKLCPNAKHHYVGKIGHGAAIPQEKIEEALIEAARNASLVVRLKGGDPFIFGRGGEEGEALAKAGVPFEMVPGISSATAVPAYAGIPLTHRAYASEVIFLTGHEDPQKNYGEEFDQDLLKRITSMKDRTLVLLMAVKNLKEIFQTLLQNGVSPDTPAALIEWGTYQRQRTLVGTLESLPPLAESSHVQKPAIIVVGEVVRLRSSLAWFEARPLLGKKILVTRAQEQAAELSDPLRHFGAELIELPTIKIAPPLDYFALDGAIHDSKHYDWILFTSANAVLRFFSRLMEVKKDIRSLGPARLAAVGTGTAQHLQDLGLKVERHPKDFSAQSLAESLSDEEIRGRRILLPRAERAREEVVTNLRSRGALIDAVSVYRNELPQYSSEYLEEMLVLRKPDLLTFTSSSTAENLHALLKDTNFWPLVKNIPSVVLGPVTQRSAEELGFHVLGKPKNSTIPELVVWIREHAFKASLEAETRKP